MTRMAISGALFSATLAWVVILTGLSFMARGPESIVANDGSSARIAYVDTSRFTIDGAGEVALRVDVRDEAGKPVPALLEDSFTLEEEGLSVKIKSVSGPGTQPINVVLVIDRSGSMQGQRQLEAQEASINTIRLLRAGRDRIGIIAFDSEYSVIQSMSELTDSLRLDLEHRIGMIQFDGGTAIGRPVVEGLRMFNTADLSGPKMLIAMTDGEDANLPAFSDSILELSRKHGVPVITISFGQEIPEAITMLKHIAHRCGGEHYHAPTGAELKSIFSSRVQDLVNEYTLTYDSPYPDPDGIDRAIALGVNSNVGKLGANATYKVGSMIEGGRRVNPVTAKDDRASSSTGWNVTNGAIFVVLLATLVIGLMVSTRISGRVSSSVTRASSPSANAPVAASSVFSPPPPPPPPPRRSASASGAGVSNVGGQTPPASPAAGDATLSSPQVVRPASTQPPGHRPPPPPPPPSRRKP